MKNTLILLILLAFDAILLAQDNEYNVLLIPEALKTDAYSVVRKYELEIDIEDHRSATIRELKAVTIFDSRSRESSIPIFYDGDSRITNIEVRIFDATGKLIRTIKKDEVIDVPAADGVSVYSDDRVKYVEAKQAILPYTVEYSYQKSLKGIGFCVAPKWMPQEEYRQSVQNSTFVLRAPRGHSLYPHSYNCEPEITKSDKGNKYKWEVQNLSAVPDELYAPPAITVLPKVLVGMDDLKIRDYIGSTSDWTQYGKLIYDLHEGRDELPPQTKEKVHQLTATASNNREKIDILYRYMQQKCRYVSVQLGIGGWQPFDAQYVDANSYGECKALSNYMKSLLKEVGIAAYPVIVYAGNQPPAIDSTLGFPTFNHEILYIPSEDYWLECTSRDNPPNYLGNFTSNRQVLLITPQGGKIANTPVLTEKDNTSSSHSTIELNANGSIKATSSIVARGIKHDRYRYLANEANEEQKRMLQSNGIYSVSPIVETAKVSVSATTPDASLQISFTDAKYASKSGRRLFVPVKPLYLAIAPITAKDKRHHDILIYFGETQTDTLLVQLPDGYTVESAPKTDIHLRNQFGSFDYTCTYTEKEMRIVRQMTLLAGKYPPETFPVFSEFVKEITKTDNQKVILVEKI